MIQTCAIPGCRLRGRHEPGCDGQDCAGCLPRTTDAGYACDRDTDRTRDRLLEIARQAPDARLVARGLVRRGDGGTSGGHESRLPLNDAATDALDEIQARLVTLALDISDTRGLHSTSATLRHPTVSDRLVLTAKWLSGQTEWLRHAVDEHGQPRAVAAFVEIRDLAGRIRGLVNGPSAQKFLGPCGAVVAWDEDGEEIERDSPCAGDVYGHPDAKEGSCRSCGARWSTEKRAAWLDGQVRDRAFRAAHIADAYGINVKTIRSWADRGQLAEHGQDREQWPLYLLGDVLDLAAEAAARRESERAKRERRAAARAAEEASEAA